MQGCESVFALLAGIWNTGDTLFSNQREGETDDMFYSLGFYAF